MRRLLARKIIVVNIGSLAGNDILEYPQILRNIDSRYDLKILR